MEEENVVADNLNTAEEEVLETSQEESDEETSTESDSELQERLAKAEELANNYRIRAEKAERLAKSKTSEAPHVSGDLSQKDVIYLAKADIHEEDTEEVVKHASVNKISVKEAHEYLKPILAVRQEQRKTASAANVGSSRRSSAQVSDEILVANAKRGILPQTEDEIMRYAQAKK